LGANWGEIRPKCDGYNRAMSNEAIAQQFLELADLTDFVGDSPFKSRAYRQAAQALESLQTPIETLAENGGTRSPRCQESATPSLRRFLPTCRQAPFPSARSCSRRFPQACWR
jgi:DNA polymerase/3'-5' exonuclease PolX